MGAYAKADMEAAMGDAKVVAAKDALKMADIKLADETAMLEAARTKHAAAVRARNDAEDKLSAAIHVAAQASERKRKKEENAAKAKAETKN